MNVLSFTLELDRRRIFHDALNIHLNELVERIQLLPDKACGINLRF
jgi:hypothetical protein